MKGKGHSLIEGKKKKLHSGQSQPTFTLGTFKYKAETLTFEPPSSDTIIQPHVITTNWETSTCSYIVRYFMLSARCNVGPPLWSSGQSSWLQIRRPGFDSRHYQKKKVLGLEWGPISLVSTTEELLDKKSSGSCLENREYGRRDVTLTMWLPLPATTSGDRSVQFAHGLRPWSFFLVLARCNVVLQLSEVLKMLVGCTYR
jgi:hypothetical protein